MASAASPTRSAGRRRPHSRSTSARSSGLELDEAGQDEMEQPKEGELLGRRLEPIDVRRPARDAPPTPRRSSSSAITRSAASAERALSAPGARGELVGRASRWSSRIPDRSSSACDRLGRRPDRGPRPAARRPGGARTARAGRGAPRGSRRRAGSGPGRGTGRPTGAGRPARLGERGDLAQPAELLLAQGRAGLGDEPGHRDDRRGELADPAVRPRSARRPRAPSRGRRAAPRRSRRPATARRSR